MRPAVLSTLFLIAGAGVNPSPSILGPAFAFAEPKAHPTMGYIRVPGLASPRTDTQPAVVSSRLVYLNRCYGGCDIHFASVDDSRMGASSIAEGTRTIPEFTQGDAVWAELVDCVKQTMAPFNIQVTDVPPNPTESYFENVVGGKGTDLRSDLANAGGVAPFDCGEIPNAITYTFDVYGPDAPSLCWTAAQEVAHAFGLDHEFLTKDPMTYLQGEMPKRYRDIDAPCGRLMMEGCQCGRTTQNSYRMIVEMFGPGAPTAPEVQINYPASGNKTQPGFTVSAKATDDVRVEKVELYIDGALAATAMTPINDLFDLPTPRELAQGSHSMEARAIDVQGTTASATLDFEQGPPCKPDGCDGTDVCVTGICVPGPSAPGGVGSICNADTECLSHQCLDAGQTYKRCVADCDVGNADSCPQDFDCLANGDTGVCWFNPSTGCCDSGTAPQGPLLVGLGVGLLVLRRRRAAAAPTRR